MEGAARRVALEALEVERLCNDALTGERGVTVDQDRERDGRVVQPCPARAIGLLCAGPALDDGRDRLEVARVRGDRDLDLAARREAGPRGGQVVLDVAAAPFGIDDERVVRPLPLELAEHGLVGAADGVDEGVQPAAVGHADHDLVRARLRRDLDRLVEHRDQHVEPFERELLLAEERAAQVLLESLDLREAL